MSQTTDNSAEGITWISTQSLIQLRGYAHKLPLNKSKIHAKQGGSYISSFKGRGMEFDESRQYQPGDDIRNIDWRVTARTGKPHTKVFQEERERPVLIWLDLNPSMFFATRGCFKSVLASKLATLIAWSAVSNNDRLGGLIFSGDEHTEIRPRRGKSAVLDFIGRCNKHSAWQANKIKNSDSRKITPRNMSGAFSRLRQVSHPGSLIFLLSDFREMDDKAYSNLANIARHNDIILIQIHDPIEDKLPKMGSFQVSDGITKHTINGRNRATREQYQMSAQQRLEKLTSFCRKNRIHHFSVSTEYDALEQLQQGLGINIAYKNSQTNVST